MPKVTFRELAMSVGANQLDTANTQLQELIGLSPDESVKAVAFFQHALQQPGFLPKAMGLKQAVESGTDDEIGDILVLCFGLDDRQRAIASPAHARITRGETESSALERRCWTLRT